MTRQSFDRLTGQKFGASVLVYDGFVSFTVYFGRKGWNWNWQR